MSALTLVLMVTLAGPAAAMNIALHVQAAETTDPIENAYVRYIFFPGTAGADTVDGYTDAVGSLTLYHDLVTSVNDIPSLVVSHPYPNPSGSTATIQVQSPDKTPSALTFALYDLRGRLVGKGDAGPGSLDLARPLSSGSYIYRLQVGGLVKATGKLVVVGRLARIVFEHVTAAETAKSGSDPVDILVQAAGYVDHVESQMLAAGNYYPTFSLGLIYPPVGGTIAIDCTPDNIGAAWSLTLGETTVATGVEDSTLTGLAAGDYAMTWERVVHYTSPAPSLVILLLAGHVDISGTYLLTSELVGDFVLVPAGTFIMGSPVEEVGGIYHETQHEVTLTQPFHIARYEVTEELWDAVLGSGKSKSHYPQRIINWFNAVEFCNAYSIQEGFTPVYEGSGTDWTWNQDADGFRMPTEAEWEYACRAGSVTAFANGPLILTERCIDPNLDVMGWYCGNTDGGPEQVGLKFQNSWGLYDMHGNVSEWCWDWSGPYPATPVIDPIGPISGTYRILRGGPYGYAHFCRSAARELQEPYIATGGTGLRLARSAF